MVLDRILCSAAFTGGKDGHTKKEQNKVVRFSWRKAAAAIACAACLGALGTAAWANGWFGLANVTTGNSVTEQDLDVIVFNQLVGGASSFVEVSYGF